jgi:hypothetical protein
MGFNNNVISARGVFPPHGSAALHQIVNFNVPQVKRDLFFSQKDNLLNC